MTPLRCPMCGGTLTFTEEKDCYICDYCTSPVSKIKSTDERIVQLKERANKLFLACDFDSAAALYQAVVSEITDDAESYWLLALCAYGIQYEEDPTTKKRIPTCHRTSFTSILNNEDYLNAIDCADIVTKLAYEESAKYIDNIQRGILEVVSKEPAYDVFICYKETESDGVTRTRESDFAKDLYYKLTAEGYKTFYAPITLQEKAGLEYEPFIFAALNSAKIMLVIGFSTEHFNAVWVKNEWSRFLSRKVKNPRLLIVPCYNSLVMDASDLPEQLAGKTQARDLSNASTNDLVSDVKKWIPKKVEAMPSYTNAVSASVNASAAALNKRGYIYIEDRQYNDALKCFDQCLNIEPQFSAAYWGQVLCAHKCKNDAELSNLGMPIEQTNEYKKAYRFANDEERNKYQAVVNSIKNKIDRNIEALKEKRNQEVHATGIEAELKASADYIANKKQQYTEFINRYEEVENEMRACANQCNEAVKPLAKRVAAIWEQTKAKRDEIKEIEQVSDADDAVIRQKMKADMDEINKIREIEYKDVVKSNECFAQLKKLKAEREKLDVNIKVLIDGIQRQTDKLERLTSQIKAIDARYEPAISQVRSGNYALASQLISLK